MIEHIVLFRCNEGTTSAARDAFVKAARQMKSEIPELLYLSAGVNWSERSDGFEMALVGRFANKETLAVYQAHPVHQKFIAEHVKPIVNKVVAVDYDI